MCFGFCWIFPLLFFVFFVLMLVCFVLCLRRRGVGRGWFCCCESRSGPAEETPKP